MIILDTNVVSEPLKPSPNPVVVEWLDRQELEALYLASTSLAELLYGVRRLDDGKRKARLLRALADIELRLFRSRVLAFERDDAVEFALRVDRAARKGVVVDVADGQIGAIAARRGYAVATRDAEPFLALGVQVVNPWKPEQSARVSEKQA